MLINNIDNENIKNYAEAMGEVNFRINSIKLLYDCTEIPSPIRVESAVLQVRKVLELIAFASLVANKQVYSKIHINKDWHPDKIVKK